MNIIEKHLDDLQLNWNNVRDHSDAQIDMLAKSIRERGIYRPLVIGSDNEILAGAGAYMALVKMEYSGPIPCVDMSHLDEDQQFALIVADNKLAERSEWVLPNVAEIMESLKLNDFDLSLTAFDPDELTALTDMNLDWMGDDEERPSASNSATAPTKTSAGFVAIEFVIPSDDKRRLIERVRDAKHALELQTDGEALVAIIDSYGG